MQQQITGRFARQAFAAHPQLGAALRAFGDTHFDGTATGQCDRHLGTEGTLPRCQRQRHPHITSIDPETRMGSEAGLKQQITGWRAAKTRAALTREPDQLTGMHAFWNAYVEGTRIKREVSAFIEPRHAQADLAGRTVPGIFDFQQYLGVMVFAAHLKCAAPCMRASTMRAACWATTTAGAPAAPGVAEQLFKEVAVITAALPITLEFKAGIPIRRRLEFLAGLVAASGLIVGRAFLRVREHCVGLVDVLHSRFCILLLRDIRMKFSREFAERLLDIRSSGIARNAQCCVVILEFHPDPPAKDAQCRKIARKTRSALDLHQHACWRQSDATDFRATVVRHR